MRPLATLSIMAISVVLLLPASVSADEPAGVIKIVLGEAYVQRGDSTFHAEPGVKVLPGDELRTGEDASLGVIFRDDSVLSLGPGSSMVLERFVFAPAEGKMRIVARIMAGTMSYLSGLIGKLAPDSIRFDTPDASIGIRGTHFAIQLPSEF